LVKPPPTEASAPADRPVLTLAEWAPLDEAFIRVKNALHSSLLAMHDIVAHMRDRRLPSATRRLYPDGRDVFELLPPAAWRGLRVEEQEAFGPTGKPTGALVARVPNAPLMFGWARVWFFVSRRDLDTLYPLDPNGREPKSASPPRSLTDHNKPGPLPTHDWPTIVAADLIRRAATGEKFPSIKTMIEHCEKVLPGGYSPGRKEMQILLKKLRMLSVQF
jgi:hypothetical protein